jgi:hypothetical protein
MYMQFLLKALLQVQVVVDLGAPLQSARLVNWLFITNVKGTFHELSQQSGRLRTLIKVPDANTSTADSLRHHCQLSGTRAMGYYEPLPLWIIRCYQNIFPDLSSNNSPPPSLFTKLSPPLA